MKNILFLSLAIFLYPSCSFWEQDEVEDADDNTYSLFNAELRSGEVIFQIPDSLLNRDMLLVSRIAQAPTDFDPKLVAGSKSTEQMVYWEKQSDHILLRAKSSNNISLESDPIHVSVINNSLDPVIERFRIKKTILGSPQYTIDVTSIFMYHRMLLSGWDTRLAKKYGKDDLDRDRSWIDGVKSFPENIEIRCFMTYFTAQTPTHDATGTVTLVMNHSFVLLPKIPMSAREYDPKMGWFTVEKRQYASDIAEVKNLKYIRRWHLVPKDMEGYECGELVEPIKPIVFYLDPATPIKWRPYFKKGIEAWNVCFETAGFKNAIIAKEPPDSPDFHPEDIRYSVIRYVANTTQNASGPSVIDPRSGQILESDIIWYHNILDLLRNRYLIETGATNPDATQLFLPDEVMGELISYVIAHEVGHAIGLSHNMKASSAYPVDSLRSPHFTGKYGITPTLMDYARFNYVAQLGDGAVEYIAKIGPYDHYAINWGYRCFSESQDINSHISNSEDQFNYRYSSEYTDFDPTTQTEGLGDDNIKASEYALKNLQIVMDSILQWASTEEADHKHLINLHSDLILMWYRYQRHVLINIGGVYEHQKNPDEKGVVFTHVKRRTQQKATSFLLRNAFTTQRWLLPNSITSRAYPQGGFDLVLKKQKRLLEELLYPQRLLRMIENRAINGASAYSIYELFSDLDQGFWRHLQQNRTINYAERALQRNYVNRLIYLSLPSDDKDPLSWKDSEIVPAAKASLLWIQEQLRQNLNTTNTVNNPNYWHYKDLMGKIDLGFSGLLPDFTQKIENTSANEGDRYYRCFY